MLNVRAVLSDVYARRKKRLERKMCRNVPFRDLVYIGIECCEIANRVRGNENSECYKIVKSVLKSTDKHSSGE